MGTDIWFYAEKKNKETKKWESIPNPKTGENDWELGRNYFMFGILSNVRNGFGFAGADQGDESEFIADANNTHDFPNDSPVYEMLDGFYGTCAPLTDFVNFNWDGVVERRGYIPLAAYKNRIENNDISEPDSYCGSVWGSGVKCVTSKEMDKLLKYDKVRPNVKYEVQISWDLKYRDGCKQLMPIIDTLKELSDESDYSDIRIICAYDC